jgi:hypothetical protein
MNPPTVIGFKPQRFPQKWFGRQIKAAIVLEGLAREIAIEAVASVLGSATVELPD